MTFLCGFIYYPGLRRSTNQYNNHYGVANTTSGLKLTVAALTVASTPNFVISFFDSLLNQDQMFP